MRNAEKELLEGALYPLPEAARLAGTTSSALARWSSSYRVRRHYAEPKLEAPLIILTAPREGDRWFSFLNLIEAHFIVVYRHSGVSLRSIQVAVEYSRRELHDEHPLRRLKFVTDGRMLFERIQREEGLSGLVAFSEAGQLAWPTLVGEFLQSVEYDEDQKPSRWWPLGKHRSVVVDPRFAFGYPVVADRHIRTDALAERFEAGEDVEEIALDFGVPKAVVQEAVRFEMALKAA